MECFRIIASCDEDDFEFDASSKLLEALGGSEDVEVLGVVEGEVCVALEGSGDSTSPLREVMACCCDPVATVSLGGGLHRGEIVPFTLTSDLGRGRHFSDAVHQIHMSATEEYFITISVGFSVTLDVVGLVRGRGGGGASPVRPTWVCVH